MRIPGNEAPGAELLDRFGSKTVDTEGSSNWIGVKDPAIDALVVQAVSARTRPELVARLRALDRVLRHHYLVVPHYYSTTFRIAYRAGKFEQPKVMPQYYQPEGWVISTWWRKQ
jgi:microcin C transport system substrate-binding protein